MFNQSYALEELIVYVGCTAFAYFYGNFNGILFNRISFIEMTFQWIKVTLVVSSWIRLFEGELNDRHLGKKAKVEGKLDQLLFYLITMGTGKWNVTESTTF